MPALQEQQGGQQHDNPPLPQRDAAAAQERGAGEKGDAEEACARGGGGGGFSAELWAGVEGTLFKAILDQPFLRGMTGAGTLDTEVFRGYLVQDALYLRAYARVLAAVASRAPRPEWVQLFLQSAVSAAQAEASFHRQFFAWFGTTPEAELAGAAPHPTNLLYTSWLLRTVNETPFYEGLAAVFPCFIVYARVGDVLKQRGSTHPLYKQWIAKYGGEEFADIVRRVAGLVDEVAEELGPAQRARMTALFHMGCRLEWMFWDAAWRRQGWPV